MGQACRPAVAMVCARTVAALVLEYLFVLLFVEHIAEVVQLASWSCCWSPVTCLSQVATDPVFLTADDEEEDWEDATDSDDDAEYFEAAYDEALKAQMREANIYNPAERPTTNNDGESYFRFCSDTRQTLRQLSRTRCQ